MSLVGYTNSDWNGSVEDWKSTFRCFFGLNFVVVSSFSRKQHSFSLSTIEVKYIATCMEVYEEVWLRKLVLGLFGQRLEPTIIHCDNQSCMKLLVNQVHHDMKNHV